MTGFLNKRVSQISDANFSSFVLIFYHKSCERQTNYKTDLLRENSSKLVVIHFVSPLALSLEESAHENMLLRWQAGAISNFDYLLYLNR